MNMIARLRNWLQEHPKMHNFMLTRAEVEELVKAFDEATNPTNRIASMQEWEE
jgi:hypothetical protein